jgi:hypothetical protein
VFADFETWKILKKLLEFFFEKFGDFPQLPREREIF